MIKINYNYILNFLLIITAFLIYTSCSTNPYKETEETYPDGSVKTVKVYKSESKTILLSETHYYEDGQKKMEGSYENGKRTGKWHYWYPDGKLWSQGVYKGGKEYGLKTVWYENGQKYYEGHNENDQRVGVWNFWNEEGELMKQVDYNK